ncbi:thiol:disulfide oxidoreductase [Rhizobium laguerreae]|uniref:glutathione binding-like protein n=1 Tax=Rhizobium laguerreae TaxID=1076926 RepID=UPI001C923BC4|nr:glutathione binding-like protein [Rhizobium laguerreae]MBY3425259.1 thiol:disulfide oxidoreductase [Rhizobium laguerreae]
MIDLHYWPTPNGQKIVLFLEETSLPYRVVPVNVAKNEQQTDAFRKLSPNGKIPAIIDNAPNGGGGPISIFESGAILVYLAGKSGSFLPVRPDGRAVALQWLFWEVANLGPMSAQQVFFCRRASEAIPFAIERYTQETTRLFGLLDDRLAHSRFLAGDDYSIADMAAFPFVVIHESLNQNLDHFPHIQRWFDLIAARPATQRAYYQAKEINPKAPSLPTSR